MALPQRVTTTDSTESNPRLFLHSGDTLGTGVSPMPATNTRIYLRVAETRTNCAPTESVGRNIRTAIDIARAEQFLAAWWKAEQQRELRPVRIAYFANPNEDALLEPIIRRLGELALLKNDWDSYGGRPPAWTALKAAYQLYSLILERYGQYLGSRVRPAAISPLASGGVELEWKGNGRLIAIEADPEGKWSMMRRYGNDRSATYSEDLDVAEDLLPAMILETLGASA